MAARRASTAARLAVVAAVLSLPACRLPAGRTADAPQPSPAAHSRVREARPPARIPRAEAWVIASASDLLGGPGATGQVGDIRIDNGRVAFVIEGLDRRWGFALGGGNLIDAGVLPGGRDALAKMFTYFGQFPRQAVYERMSIRTEADGTVVVRVEGRDSMNHDLAVSTEYALAPLVDFLEISTVVENRGTRDVELPLGDAIQWGGLRPFMPGFGFDLRNDAGAPWVAGLGNEICLGYGTYDEPIRGPSGSAWTDTVLKIAELHPGGSAAYDRVLIVTGAADTARIAARIHTLRGDPLGTVTGLALGPDGRPVEDARVEIRDSEGRPQAIAATDQDGRYTAQLPQDDYALRVSAPGRAGGQEVAALIAARTTLRVDLPMSRESDLRYRLRETGRGRPDDLVPGKLTFEGLEGTPTPDFGPRFRTRGRNVVYTSTGKGRVPLAAGHYRVTASRGPEYALSVQDITVAEGQNATLDAVLTRVVDSSGFLCGDFHQHTIGSSDASTTIRDRMISNAGEGVEIAVASDHNVVSDFSAAVRALDLQREIFTIQGNEVTTDTSPKPIGHFNVYPLPRDTNAADGGAWDVFALTAGEIFALARADGVDRVIQVNHPRSHDNGFFALSGYDPQTNAGRPGMWAADFDAIEVFNSNRTDRTPAILTDVYAMWNRGLTPTIMGSSDTHSVIGDEPGFPRTCLAVGDDPATLTVEAVVDALKRTRNVFVTNGPFVRMRFGSVEVGGLARAHQGRVLFDVDVQAAPWIDVTTLQLVVNGEPLEPVQLPVLQGPRPVVRFHGTLPARLRRDSWVQLIVRGDGNLLPVVQHDPPDGPLALTNPIWVDVDGNGRFDPPITPEPDAAPPAAERPATRPAHPAAAPRPAPGLRLPRVNPADR